MKLTLNKLAKLTGVSQTTVSFVMNGKGDEMNISKTTQKRILETAKRYNYQPNHAARILSMGRSLTIAFVVPDISNPFFSKIARLVEYYAEQKGYSVMFANTDENKKKEHKILTNLIARQIDGIIVAPTSETIYQDLTIPTVIFDRINNQQKNFIAINNKDTAYQLTKALIKKGHDEIALFSVSSFLPNIKERIVGYRQALRDNNIPYNELLVNDIDPKNIKRDIKKVLSSIKQSNKSIKAALFLNNVLAAEFIWIINAFNKQRNDLLSLASFDNLDMFDYLTPKIISASQPSDMIAQKSVEMLFKQIDNNIVSDGVFLQTEIIKR